MGMWDQMLQAYSYQVAYLAVRGTTTAHLRFIPQAWQDKPPSSCVVWQVGERERIEAAEEALARRRRVVAKLEAQANCQAQQQRAFSRVSPHPTPLVSPSLYTPPGSTA